MSFSYVCHCIRCSECDGRGTTHVPDISLPEGFDIDTCDECRGLGVEECLHCAEAREEFEREHF